MEALLASPSGYSPPGSPDERSFSSLNLPALSSPFGAHWDSSANNTPTPATTSSLPPAWITDELDEEWVEDHSGEEGGEEEEEGSFRGVGSTSTSLHSTSGSPTVTQSNARSYSGVQKRLPSSVRYAFTSSSSTLANSTNKLELVERESSESPQSVGTFVLRGSEGVADGREGEEGEESQLQAAVRLLQGPTSGLGAPVEQGDMSPSKSDKLGLMRMFEPPSPPLVLPQSTVSAPSIDLFSFPVQSATRPSWKDLAHFSASDSSTPVKPPPTTTPNETTPVRVVYQLGPAPKAQERYLRSTAASQYPSKQDPIPTKQASLPPFPTTPAPTPSSHLQHSPAVSTPGLRIFEFQYDTFTRDHLAALVDEIDELGASRGATRIEEHAWETSFIDVVQPHDAASESDEDAVERSTKRIRLSPVDKRRAPGREDWSRRAGGSSGRGSFERRSGYGASRRRGREQTSPMSVEQLGGQGTTTTRDRLGQANALLDKIRARTAERDRIKAETAPSPMGDEERRGVFEAGSSDEGGDTTEVMPRVERHVSPRRTLRHISASDEVDQEIQHAFPATQADDISSAIRAAYGTTPSTRNDFDEPQSAPPSPSKRHFARTPVSRRSRTSESPAEVRTRTSSNGTQDEETPQRARRTSLTTIGPNDVKAILTSASAPSRMVFDQAQGCWIKAPRPISIVPGSAISRSMRDLVLEEEQEEVGGEQSGSTEDDPFADFDDSRNSSELVETEVDLGLSGLGIFAGTPGTPAAVVSPLDANYFEAPPPGTTTAEIHQAEDEAVWGIAGGSTGDIEAAISECFDGELDPLDVEESPFQLYTAAMDAREPAVVELVSAPSPAVSTPLRRPVAPSPVPTNLTPRPVPITAPSFLPRSALKPTVRSQSEPGLHTPTQADVDPKGPRSVSFSDGKTTGQMQGLDVRRGSGLKYEVGEVDSPTGFVEWVEEPESVAGLDSTPDSSILALTPLMPSGLKTTPLGRPRSGSQPRTFRRTTAADATFLTECSFGVSHELLVRYITDVEPFEPNWEGLMSIDLAKKGVESLVRLKEFIPRLDEGIFNNNEISFLTGVPSTIRTLLISSNRLSDITSFAHLCNLESLDLSHNQLESVSQLACLPHLRDLKADHNKIKDLGGLVNLDGLVRLSLKGNCLESVDFGVAKWTRLETLNLSMNKMSSVVGVERLQALSSLDFDHNLITSISPRSSMPALRILRLCSNPLASIDVEFAPNLRTLFADDARLGEVAGTDRLRKLENLSLRDQAGEPLTLDMNKIRDVRRLYLSGNPIPTSFPSEKFFNLVYLELAMCQITSLPPNLASLIPNVHVLNLNFNFLEDLSPLVGLTRLKKLTALGARISQYRSLAGVLGSMDELESVDLRMNPLTLSFYPPLLVPPPSSTPHADDRIVSPVDSSPSPSQLWTLTDRKFRKALPKKWYFKRMTYRAIILQMVPSLIELDGVGCAGERPRIRKTLEGLDRMERKRRGVEE